jgi:hypothetical protein
MPEKASSEGCSDRAPECVAKPLAVPRAIVREGGVPAEPSSAEDVDRLRAKRSWSRCEGGSVD